MKTLLLLLVYPLAQLVLSQPTYYLTADRVFDGERLHEKWAVVVSGKRILAVGPQASTPPPPGASRIYYPNTTLGPGLIEGHAHLFLYPYNITDWDTQVLKETDAYRTVRATVHAKNTLLAGFTTVRDLGTEGAGYADVALKRAIQENIVPGPRMLVAGRAIVSTGSYGPKGYDSDMKIMLGAEEADGHALVQVTRDQIGKGADFIKVYADYRWGLRGEDQPSFTLDELKLINEVTRSSGRVMVCHAKSKEAMRRAILAGAETIEHGDYVDDEIAALMKQYNVVYFPTLGAVESLQQYRGWKKGITPEPALVTQKKKAFAAALKAGVSIGMGGDVGVYPHGNNVLEMELMVEYGMTPVEVWRAATRGNARAFHLENEVGLLAAGLQADVLIVEGNPAETISDLRKVKCVMKDGELVRQEK